MKKILTITVFMMMFTVSACAQGAAKPDNNPTPKEDGMKIKITAGGKDFTATLHDNAASQSFMALLPMTVNMTEMGGQEKYYNLSQTLPGQAVNPGTIHEGDILIWSGNCLVLFYTTFSTSYRYIRLGRVDNVSGFRTALGTGNVQVTFASQ